jgi:nucleoid-associated protein YgaU
MTTPVALMLAGDAGSESGTATTPANLAKASLSVHEPRALASGGYDPGATLLTIDFHFNPKELSFSKSAKWPRQPAKGAAKSATPEFSGAEPTKLTLEMFFDSSMAETSSVLDSVESLMSCCIPTSTTKTKDRPHPPLVMFHWGAIQSVPVFISQVTAKYTRFDGNGTPIRATCNVSMEDMPAEIHSTNPTSGATGVRGHHLFAAGDSLASLAYREYQDPSMWRAIADVNGIDDPLRVRVGTTLLMPRADELKAGRA